MDDGTAARRRETIEAVTPDRSSKTVTDGEKTSTTGPRDRFRSGFIARRDLP
ncbi:hypothetical protein STXM2123_5719 [Streptomyces sp. F-3]|jgi:hypothetical protein|nr:hypothetical protein STXM2123_5719 [Streptomyces sp. F-3]